MYRAAFFQKASKWSCLFLCLAGWPIDLASAQSENDDAAGRRWAIALHGGAGRLTKVVSPEEDELLTQAVRQALAVGTRILSAGGSALDAVQAVVVVLEDDPLFNAGKGAIFTRAGSHELDASIMDGDSLRSGGVTGVKATKNPIMAARLVMERTPHLLLQGKNADEFAMNNGCERVVQEYFYTDRRFGELQLARVRAGLDRLQRPAYPMQNEPRGQSDPDHEGPSGTVGCVAMDVNGMLAAATSTGGRTDKLPGRVGDTPICGAGNYANKLCAVSGTGKGEEFMRHLIAARVAWLMEERKLSVDDAVRYCLQSVMQPGDGGLIAVDRHGRVSMHSTTLAMPRAMADSTGRIETAIWIDANAATAQ